MFTLVGLTFVFIVKPITITLCEHCLLPRNSLIRPLNWATKSPRQSKHNAVDKRDGQGVKKVSKMSKQYEYMRGLRNDAFVKVNSIFCEANKQ